MKSVMNITVGAICTCMAITQSARAQTPDIVAFSGNGSLSWTNSNSNLFYQVQWSASLGGGGSWTSQYSSLLDIQSTNPIVTTPVPMYYRIASTTNRMQYAARLPMTGQTTPYRTGDDGDLEKGVAWPVPRFAIQTDTNLVIDNVTGLMWVRNADVTEIAWAAAIDYCETLNYGGHSDWRLPNKRELLSLTDDGHSNPTLPTGHPFTGVNLAFYWSSTTYADFTAHAWAISMGGGFANNVPKTDPLFVWPVRGGN